MISHGSNINDLQWPWRSSRLFETFLYLIYFGQYSTYLLRYVYMRIRKRAWSVGAIILSKFKDFSRSQAVTFKYTVKVVVSCKRWKIETLSPQNTERKWCMAHQIASFVWPWASFKVMHLLQAFYVAFFVYLCSSWQDFNSQRVARSLCDSWVSCTNFLSLHFLFKALFRRMLTDILVNLLCRFR